MTGPYDQPCAQTAAPKPAEDGSPCPKARRPFVLAASILGSAMVFIDGTALTVALPVLRDGLEAGPAALNWIVNAYVLVLAAFTLIGGAAADRFGRKRVFSIAAIGFALASALCALAPDPALLIAGRALQGLFGAALAPASLAMLAAAYPGGDRGAAIGTWAGASALTTAAGPLVAGGLIDTFGWPSVFLINLPIAAAAAFLALRFSPETTDEASPKAFDLPGAGFAALALGLIAWGLVSLGGGESDGAGDAALDLGRAASLLAAGLLVFSGFVWRQHTARDPMVPLQLFKNAEFSSANAFTLMAYTGLSATMFVLPLSLADARGWSASEVGLAFLPFTLGVGLLSRAFGGLGARLGEGRVLLVGGGLAALAFGWLGAAHESAAPWLGVFAPMGLAGIAFALFIPTLTTVAVSSVSSDQEGLASGVNNAVSRVASLAGTAGAAGAVAASVGGVALYAGAVAAILGGVAGWTGARRA